MKILVMGTIGDEWDDKKKRVGDGNDEYKKYLGRFHAASLAIGKAVAERGHTVIVTAMSWGSLTDGTGVARDVIQGVNAAKPSDGQPAKIILYAPRDAEPEDKTPDVSDSVNEFRKMGNIVLDERFSHKAVRISYRIPDVKEADAVIVIDGSAGVQAVATAAFSLNKPIVPLRSFGSVPNELFNEFLKTECDLYVERREIGADSVRAITSPWESGQNSTDNDMHAAAIVALAEKLVAIHARADRQNTTWLMVTVAVTVISIFFWVVAFTSHAMQSHSWSFFFVLFLSVWPGIGLRTLVSYQQGITARLTWQGLLIDFAVANVIAIGLALLFLIGNIAFTGELAADFGQGNSNDFARIAVIMSLFGLAAGYLVPLGRLRELLENTLAQQR